MEAMNPNAQNLLLDLTPYNAQPAPKTLRMLTFRNGRIKEASPSDPVFGVSEGNAPVTHAIIGGPCFIEAGEAIEAGDTLSPGPEGVAMKAGKKAGIYLALTPAAASDAVMAIPIR